MGILVTLRANTAPLTVNLTPSTPSTLGYLKYWNGSSWELKPVKYWNGSAWVQKPIKRWNGIEWV